LSAALNCTGPSNLTCVRAAPATTIKSIIDHQALIFNPVADNVTLVSDPALRRVDGQIADIPTLSGSNSQEGRVFETTVTTLSQFYSDTFPNNPSLWSALDAAYPAGSDGLNTVYDIASQIFTEFYFQCPEALFANASATSGLKTWRYYFNASFPNTQGFPNGGVYHSSELGLVFKSYYPNNVTIQEEALSEYMQGAWARFAKDPAGGPGWNAVGTGANYVGGESDEDLGVLGNVGDVTGSGVTVIRESDVDGRCGLFKDIYESILDS
jgi:carboxylesterase type B